MRKLFALVLLLPLLIPCVGCGGGRPDPQDRPDFVDTTDPGAVADPSAAVGGPAEGGGAAGAPAAKPDANP